MDQFAVDETKEGRRRWWYGRIEKSILKMLAIFIVAMPLASLSCPLAEHISAGWKRSAKVRDAVALVEVRRLDAIADSVARAVRMRTDTRNAAATLSSVEELAKVIQKYPEYTLYQWVLGLKDNKNVTYVATENGFPTNFTGVAK